MDRLRIGNSLNNIIDLESVGKLPQKFQECRCGVEGNRNRKHQNSRIIGGERIYKVRENLEYPVLMEELMLLI